MAGYQDESGAANHQHEPEENQAAHEKIWPDYPDSVQRSLQAPGEIVAHRVSASLGMDLSLAVIAQATSPAVYQATCRSWHCAVDVRKGNCLDNVPVESFFGHMKDDLDLSRCYFLDQVRAVVVEYIYNYNHHRYQWGRKKVAPVNTGTTFWRANDPTFLECPQRGAQFNLD